MTKKVSLVNMKGGVGKSTIAVNLAWHFARHREWHKRVLLVDLDPQFNASQYLLGKDRYAGIIKNNEATIWDVFEQYTRTPGLNTTRRVDPHNVVHRRWPSGNFNDGAKLDLIPSRLEVAFSLMNPSQKEGLLADLISQIEAEYDLILFDCPPTESLFTQAAYLASDYVLVPVKPEYLSSIGLPLLATSVKTFLDRNPARSLEIAGIVFNGVNYYSPEETKSMKEIKELASENHWYLFKNMIEYSKSYPTGSRTGKAIAYTPYAHWDRIKGFQKFAEEFGERIGL